MSRAWCYIPQGTPLHQATQTTQYAASVAQREWTLVVNRPFDSFMNDVEAGDTVVVGSLTLFSSLVSLFSWAALGVAVHSVDEPWYGQPIDDPMQYTARLHALGQQMHIARTCRGMEQAEQQGRRAGRVAGSKNKVRRQWEPQILEVERLRREEGLTLHEACSRQGISTHIYYRCKK